MSMTKTTLTRLMAISEASPSPFLRETAALLRDVAGPDDAVTKMAKMSRRMPHFSPADRETVIVMVESLIGIGAANQEREARQLAAKEAKGEPVAEVAQARAAHAVDAD